MENSVYQNSEARILFNDYLIEHYWMIENLTKNRPVVTEMFEIEHGIWLLLLAHLDSSENQNDEANI